ncbi:hypothetical protein FB451DRAFT_669476 [Mycena latifolia]|nr:hypothetical protein FB451DRAFT_669476 [Mycena latifolia]
MLLQELFENSCYSCHITLRTTRSFPSHIGLVSINVSTRATLGLMPCQHLPPELWARIIATAAVCHSARSFGWQSKRMRLSGLEMQLPMMQESTISILPMCLFVPGPSSHMPGSANSNGSPAPIIFQSAAGKMKSNGRRVWPRGSVMCCKSERCLLRRCLFNYR